MREREISVDINGGAFKFLKYKQYDHNNLLKIIVKEGKDEVDLTGYTARAFFERPDGVVLEKNCTIVSNKIKLMITNDVLARKGKVSTEITLSDGNKIVTTFRMYLEVEGSIDRNSAIEEDPEWDLIKDGLGVLDTKANQSDLISLTNRVITNESDIENLENTIDVMYSSVEGSYISTDSSAGYLKDVEILGNTIQNEDNLEDIRSVGDKIEGQELYEIPVLSCGKNLFDKDKVVLNYYNQNGTPSSFKNSFYGWVKVKSNTRYTVYYKSNSTPFRPMVVEFLDDKKTVTVSHYTGQTYTSEHSFSFTTNENTKFVCLSQLDVDNSNFDKWDIQIEEGTVATPYEPYVEDKLTILSPVQLEKVGDVRDRIIEKDGVWGVEKNIYTELLNGQYNFEKGNISENTVIYQRLFSNLKANSNDITCILSDKFLGVKNNDWVLDKESVFLNSEGYVQFRVNHTTLGDMNFAEYTTENNILFKAQLREPQFIPLPYDQQVKLRTFANKTNISFLTEVEGTIKAQVPKSIGATVNTHTEQIGNLNKELDRVKKLEESTVSTIETESDFTTVEATSGGYFEDVKLEGKTLTNTVTTYDVSKFSLSNAIKQDDGYFKLQYGATVNDSNVIPRYGVHLYKPSTTYTIVVDIKENTTGTFLGISTINSCIDSTTISVRNFTNLTGISTITFKTRDDITISDKGVTPTYDLYFGIWKDGGDLSKHITFKYWVLEGDHTQNPPSFFEGLKSVGDTTDEIVVSSNNNQSEQIETTDDNGTTTTIDNPDYQADKKRLLFYNEETQTWEKPVLREWDSIEKHANGKYYYHQRSAEVVLNGSEDWTLNTKVENYTRAYIPLKTAIAGFNQSKMPPIISDKFKVVEFNTMTSTEIEGVSLNTAPNLYIKINDSKLSTQDLAGFKAWLQANNVTVVYKLAQEKVYECTNIDLITYERETNYIVECGAIVPKSTLKVLQNATNIIRQLQQKVSVLETDNNRIMQILSDIRNN